MVYRLYPFGSATAWPLFIHECVDTRRTHRKTRRMPMTRQEFESRIASLRQQINTLPAGARPALEALVRETVDRHARITSACDTLRTGVDDLRLSQTYLRFDLEATRRENAVLKRHLASRANDDDNRDHDTWTEGAD